MNFEIDKMLEELKKLGVSVEVVHCSSYDKSTDIYKEWNEYSLYNKNPLLIEKFTDNAFKLWCSGFLFGSSQSVKDREEESVKLLKTDIVRLLRNISGEFQKENVLLPVELVEVLNGNREESGWENVKISKVLKFIADMMEE